MRKIKLIDKVSNEGRYMTKNGQSWLIFAVGN